MKTTSHPLPTPIVDQAVSKDREHFGRVQRGALLSTAIDLERKLAAAQMSIQKLCDQLDQLSKQGESK